jgi:hypothetical protein
MGTRRHFRFLAAVVASGALSSSWVHVAAHPGPASGALTAIATAQTSERSPDRAARATESVHYADTTLVLLASYAVADGLPAIPATSTDLTRDSRLWGLVESTLPDDAVLSIRQMNVISDGRNGTLGMVHRSSFAPGSWVLSIDPAETDDVLQDTMVHEYAHMLTLRTEDLTSNAASRTRCDGLRIEIGCAKFGSALAAWHDEFWAGTAEPAPTDTRKFVSEYASSSVHEDLAESFMAWTLDQVTRPSAQVRARFAFFENRPEFVEARDAILAKLDR